ncbi:hypothetical protein C8035_v012219 [Colletotrichum spinosum]|uniref:Uncharacterized protein n=1 Tax=Colletotrichum spinosum TaxID=1347390 RepID=A0A4R8PRI3_9PEZI|nr:hypothetical protein C8035_v012219 [Colletotrichum spinosum]
MKWTTGAPLGKPLSLRKTKVHDSEEDWAYDDSATVYSDSSYTQYAWVTPRWDDRVAVIAGRSDSRVSRGSMKAEPARAPPTFAPSHYQQPRFFPAQQPPPPPPPPIVPPPGRMYDDGETYDEYGEYEEGPFHHGPPPPPPTNIGTGDSAPFIILDGAGGSHPPGKYDDWAD